MNPHCDFSYYQKEDLEKWGFIVQVVNNSGGKKLVELCQMSNMKIINGRFGKDRGVGDITCQTARGSSAIDYAIASSELLAFVSNFEIDEFDRCLSDAHRPVRLQLHRAERARDSTSVNNPGVRDSLGLPTTQQHPSFKVRWRPDLKEAYGKEFAANEMERLQNLLTEVENKFSCQMMEQDDMDDLTELFKTNLIEPATRLHMAKLWKPSKHKQMKRQREASNKPWFNSECKKKRKEYVHSCKKKAQRMQ